MKLIIAGGRGYNLTVDDYVSIRRINPDEVVSGGCSGADRCGEKYAILMGTPIKIFEPNWEEYGRKAGPMRNKEMAEYADGVILFPGGRGTESMFNEAIKAGIKVFDYRNKDNRGVIEFI